MGKKQWTVERGPRVYEVAIFLGLGSRDVMHDLWWWGFEGKSASSTVPLPMALDYSQRSRDIKWRCPVCTDEGVLGKYDCPGYLV